MNYNAMRGFKITKILLWFILLLKSIDKNGGWWLDAGGLLQFSQSPKVMLLAYTLVNLVNFWVFPIGIWNF
jgi:hypothetical protein